MSFFSRARIRKKRKNHSYRSLSIHSFDLGITLSLSAIIRSYLRSEKDRRLENGWSGERISRCNRERNPFTVHARSDIERIGNGVLCISSSMEWNRIESARATRDSEGTPRGGSGSGRSGFLEKCTLAHLPARNPTPLHFTPLHSMSTRLSARSSTPLHSTRLRSVHGSKLARSTHNDSPRSPLFFPPALSRPFSGFLPSLSPLITIAILKLLLLLLLFFFLGPVSRGELFIYLSICMCVGWNEVKNWISFRICFNRIVKLSPVSDTERTIPRDSGDAHNARTRNMLRA